MIALIRGKSSPCQTCSEKGLDLAPAVAALMLRTSTRRKASRSTHCMSSLFGSGGGVQACRVKRASISMTSRSSGERTSSCKQDEASVLLGCNSTCRDP